MKVQTKSDLRALSIVQPWAECIVFYGKNIENRSWSTERRGYIAIHASAKFDKNRYDKVKKKHRLNIDPDNSSFGCILGFARITDVVDKHSLTRKTKKWFVGDYGFVLDDIIVLKDPVPAKGSLGFWKIPSSVLTKCLKQMKKTEVKKLLG